MAGYVQSQLSQNGPELVGREQRQLDDLVAVLSTWSTGHGPLYRRLARAIRAAVERGDLPAGAPLPPERRLAPKLSVGRGTVVAAYELLRQEHVVERRQGSGTRVVDSGARPTRRAAATRGSAGPASSPPFRPGATRPPSRNAIF